MGEVRVRVKRRPTNEIALISFYQRKTSIPQRRVACGEEESTKRRRNYVTTMP